jgi:hypothetical protein
MYHLLYCLNRHRWPTLYSNKLKDGMLNKTSQKACRFGPGFLGTLINDGQASNRLDIIHSLN